MTMTASQSVAVPKWVTDFILIGALAPLLRITDNHIGELTKAAGEPATRLEVFILSYLKKLIPRSLNPPLGVGFASNSEATFQQLLKNFAVTELPRVRQTDTPHSLDINIMHEISRPHSEINLLDLLHLDQAVDALTQDTVNLRVGIDRMDSLELAPLLFQVSDDIQSRFYSAENHLRERLRDCQWPSIIIFALFLHKHENHARSIPPQVFSRMKRYPDTISAFIAESFEEAAKFSLND